jgi:hypothetical protein
MVSTKEVVLMKNFTKKLALLLVFAMVLGVVSPTIVAKAAASDYKIHVGFEDLYFRLSKTGASGYVQEYEFTQYVGDTAPTADQIKAIKEKDWVSVGSDTYAEYGDLSWFNKKKASYIVVRIYENNAYTYIVSDKIAAQEDALKVLYSDKNEAAATTKTPAYTSAQAVGSKATGYFVFYRGKTNPVVITPTGISFRVDGSYHYHVVKSNTSGGGGVVHDYFAQYLKQTMGAKGATFYFVETKNANTTDSEGWPVKEAKYKYAAQKNAPSVKLDITHVVPLKAGQEYRIVNASTKKRSDWVSDDTAHGKKENKKVQVGKILLEDLVVTKGAVTSTLAIEDDFITEAGKLDPAALARGDVKLQVRTAASSKGVASKIYSVVVTQAAIGTATSTASIDGAAGAELTVSYKKTYDATSGLVIKNNNTTDNYEVCFLTSGASVTATDKWTTVKAGKSVEVKSLKTKSGDAYTNFLVRKVGDKKNGILSSNYHTYAIADVAVTTQTITPVANGTITGIASSAAVVTSAGAVTITLPKAAASGAAIEEKSFEVTVAGVTNPGTLKWASKGSNKAFTVPVPTYANNKVTFKFAVKKDTTSGDSGEYKCAVEGLNFTFKIVIGN